MKKLLPLVFVLAAGSLALADMPSPQSPVTTALRRALGSRAEWTMVRQIGTKGQRLASSGTVDCVPGSGIVWRVTSPFESSVSMTPEAMVFVDEDGTRTKPLSKLPHYAAMRKKTDAFAAGDAKSFDGLFNLDASVSPKGGWLLRMTPEIAAMKRLFTEVVLTGEDLPTNAVLRTADGGSCEICFKPIR